MRGKVAGQGDKMYVSSLAASSQRLSHNSSRVSRDLQGKVDLHFEETVSSLIKDRELVDSPVSSSHLLAGTASCIHPTLTTLHPSSLGLPWASHPSKTLSSRESGRVGQSTPERSQHDSLGGMFEDTCHGGFLHHATSSRSSPGDIALLSDLHFSLALKSLLKRNPSA